MFRVIIFAVYLVETFALYPSSSDVILLNPNNFDSLVVNNDDVWIVEFFASWCGHCQQLVPEYQKAATALKGVVKVGAINADEHKDFGKRFDVRGFPTIKIFGKNKKKPEEFSGSRNAQGIVDSALNAARNQIYGKLGVKASQKGGSSSDVIELTDSNFDRLVLQSEDMWLVEFFAPWCGHCKNLAPQWAEAATSLKGKVKLGALDATINKMKAAEYRIEGFPTIKYFGLGKKSANSAVNYNGGRSASNIISWALERLSENLPPPEITQIVNEESFKEDCHDKPLCVISILPNILDCQSQCRNDYLNLLRKMGEKFKEKMWGWIWAEANSQPELENALDIGGFGYPTMVVLNTRKLKYSLLRGSFSEVGIKEFLRDLSYGRGNSVDLRGAKLPGIVDTIRWDGKDGVLPQEEDLDVDEKDEL
ncbi:protein disulfide-isomerase a6 [Holotrichia oblita]|uniref:Protein disulfide-isomerase a6 n=1 Tax=Holotrichia oblita TaxID=644536 RepID=A0ACB9TAG5_HOLOL|nr:protein disulfide-isomerase a6 [Holotrichia oblita]